MSIRYYAETTGNAKHRKALAKMADRSDAFDSELDAMPEWAKECAIDLRVPVSVKIEHDGLEVDHWTSASGKTMHRVHWADGTVTQYDGDLSGKYVEWNR